jgi:hypothetical protein
MIMKRLETFWVYRLQHPGRSIPGHGKNYPGFITLADAGTEYREAEIYYLSLINQKFSQIESFDFHGNTEDRELVLRELSEMDQTYRLLEKELNAEAGNRMVIDAMLMHYQLRVDILGMILERLRESGSAGQLHDEAMEDPGFITDHPYIHNGIG